jgi:hypothetical protein
MNFGPGRRSSRATKSLALCRVCEPSDGRVVEQVRSARPVDKVVRFRRPKFQGFARTGEGHLG